MRRGSAIDAGGLALGRRRLLATPARIAGPFNLPVEPQFVHHLAHGFYRGAWDERPEFERFIRTVRLHPAEDGRRPRGQLCHDFRDCWGSAD
jgi:hypothetical protein